MTDNFEKRAASIRNAFDIFAGQWCSNIPLYGGGPANLFQDTRILQFDQYIGGFAGKKVIELGPLEGGHTYCMSVLGASEILAIEANKDAFLRCLVVKECLDLKAKFVLGDFESYLYQRPPKVDVILASGVLYHMKNPLKVIEAMCGAAEQLCIWTHYYDKSIIDTIPHLANRFDAAEVVDFMSRKIVCGKQAYIEEIKRVDFAGGLDNYSYWVSLEGFEGALDALGYDMNVIETQPNHPHGPGVTFVATRRKSNS